MSLTLDPEAIAAAPPEAPRPNLLKLLLGIWVRPRATLAAVAAGPGWVWLIPLLLAAAFLIGRVLVAGPLQIEQQIAQQQQMQEESMANMPPEMRESLSPEAFEVHQPPLSAVITLPLVAGLAGIVLGWLARAGILHLGSMLFGGRQGFAGLYRVGAWAGFPLILRDAVQMLYMRLSHSLIEGSGLSGLAASTADSNLVAGGGMVSAVAGGGSAAPTALSLFLGRIDLYTLWFLGLLLVGLIAGGLSRGKALIVILFYAGLTLLPAFLPLLFGGMTGGF
ncbi:MAG: YIP1 family protein [Caldilineales bacterium]|nr:YIP1 family protein [Caldilineales bacterium]